MREMAARGYDCRDLSRTSGHDAGDEASVNRFFGELGRLDVLVNNAAILELAHVVDMKIEKWAEVIRVDLREAFLCTRATFRLLGPGPGRRKRSARACAPGPGCPLHPNRSGGASAVSATAPIQGLSSWHRAV